MPQDPPPPPKPPFQPPPELHPQGPPMPFPQWNPQDRWRGELHQVDPRLLPPPPPPPKPVYVIPPILIEYWQESGPNFVGPPSPRTEQWMRRLREALLEWQNQGGGFA